MIDFNKPKLHFVIIYYKKEYNEDWKWSGKNTKSGIEKFVGVNMQVEVFINLFRYDKPQLGRFISPFADIYDDDIHSEKWRA